MKKIKRAPVSAGSPQAAAAARAAGGEEALVELVECRSDPARGSSVLFSLWWSWWNAGTCGLGLGFFKIFLNSPLFF